MLAPRNGAWVQPQATGVSLGLAVILKACPPPRKWFPTTDAPNWLPTSTKSIAVELPRASTVLGSVGPTPVTVLPLTTSSNPRWVMARNRQVLPEGPVGATVLAAMVTSWV